MPAAAASLSSNFSDAPASTTFLGILLLRRRYDMSAALKVSRNSAARRFSSSNTSSFPDFSAATRFSTSESDVLSCSSLETFSSRLPSDASPSKGESKT